MRSQFEHDYMDLVRLVIESGEARNTRAGPTRSLFGTTLRIDALQKGQFPVLTHRKIFYHGILGELAAFLRGATLVSQYEDEGCNYWRANAAAWDANDDKASTELRVGKVYGAQWRRWSDAYNIGKPVDQLAMLIASIRDNPSSRRHLLTTYNPAELHMACLPPCHLLAQFNVQSHGLLDCIVYMRSVDLCLGLPSDIVLYAGLLILIAKEASLVPGKLVFMMGDTHVYTNHIPVWQHAKQQPTFALPQWKLSDTSTDDFVADHLQLVDYQCSGATKYAFNV